MNKLSSIFLVAFCTFAVGIHAQNIRNEVLLEKNWRFAKGDYPDAVHAGFDITKWALW
jgi:beta-galactosidase